MLLKNSSWSERVDKLKYALALHRHGIRVAVDSADFDKLLLVSLDLVYRAQFTEGFFGLARGSITRRAVDPSAHAFGKREPKALAQLIKRAWRANVDGVIVDALNSPCRINQIQRGNLDGDYLNSLADNFKVEGYRDWWSQEPAKALFVGPIRNKIRTLVKQEPKLSVSGVFIDLIYSPGEALGIGHYLGRSMRAAIVDCKRLRWTHHRDPLDAFLLNLMQPQELVGLIFRKVESEVHSKLNSIRGQSRRLQHGIPIGPGDKDHQFPDNAKSLYVDQFCSGSRPRNWSVDAATTYHDNR